MATTRTTFSYTQHDGSITKVVHDPEAFNGTWLQGIIDSTYSELVSVFGHPTAQHVDCKTKAEWSLRIDGIPVTIYDYKEYDKELDRITDWHIGGGSVEAFNALRRALEAGRQNLRNRQN